MNLLAVLDGYSHSRISKSHIIYLRYTIYLNSKYCLQCDRVITDEESISLLFKKSIQLNLANRKYIYSVPHY